MTNHPALFHVERHEEAPAGGHGRRVGRAGRGVVVLSGLAAVASTSSASVATASTLPSLGLDFAETAGAPVPVDGTFSITVTVT